MVKNLIRTIATTVVFIVGIALILGSATGPREVTQYKFEPKADSSTEFEQDNLIVRIKAIDGTNYKKFPAFYTKTMYSHDQNVKKRWEDMIAICDFPVFEMTITNNTGHILRFNKAVIKMQDDAGNLYDATMKSEQIEKAKEWIERRAVEDERFYDKAIVSKTKKLKLIDNNFELLPNFTQKGYLLFNLEDMSSREDYVNFVTSSEFFKVMLYEIPVVTDEAGVVSKTTNFQFVYVVNEKVVTIQ